MVIEPKITTTLLVVSAFIGLGFVAVVIVQLVESLIEEGDARGCPIGTPAANASKGRCVNPGGGPFKSEVNPFDSSIYFNYERSTSVIDESSSGIGEVNRRYLLYI